MSYVAFPFFVAYAANGPWQGWAMVFVLMALVQFFRGKRSAWLWLLAAPYWHSRSWLAVMAIIAHQLMCGVARQQWVRWCAVLIALGMSIVASATGLNRALFGQLPDAFEIQPKNVIVVLRSMRARLPRGLSYQLIVSPMIPLSHRLPPTRESSDLRLWCVRLVAFRLPQSQYHLPLIRIRASADRFAGFSWFLMPFGGLPTGTGGSQQAIAWAFCNGGEMMAVNVVMLQFYTGSFFSAPEWW